MTITTLARRLGVVALLAAPLAMADFEVNSTADGADLDTGDDICNTRPNGLGDPECTLRAAIQQANATAGTDEITFSVTGAIALNNSLPPISSHINITGNGDITLQCNTQIQPVAALAYTSTATGVAYTLSDLSITGCETGDPQGGAAVRFVAPGAGSSLSITNVSFDSNEATAGPGGAIRLGASNPNSDQASLRISIQGGSLSSNAASAGGGAIYSTANLSIDGTTVSDNTGGDTDSGGAIASILGASGGSLVVSNATFSGNVAGSGATGAANGGAIYSTKAFANLTTEISDSTFTGNVAVNGGGLAVGRGGIVVSNSTFSANTASGRGGAIFLGNDGGNGSAELSNVTLSGNTAAAGGGMGADDNNNGGTLAMVNATLVGNDAHGIDLGANQAVFLADTANNPFHKNLLADNTPANCAQAISHNDLMNSGSHVSTDASCGFTQTTDTQDAMVNLDALGDYGGNTQTHRLLAGSAAIDAGDDMLGTASDQRGAPAADGDQDMTTARDAGAYEFAGFSAVEFTATGFMEAENNTPALVTARRFGDLSSPVTATVENDASGTATPGADFEAVSEMVTWAAADGAAKTVEVTLEDDNMVEGDETVGLVFSTVPTGVDLGPVNPATLTITDVEEGEFNLQNTALTATEGTDAMVSVVITRNGGADGASEVQLTTSDGGTGAGQDDDPATAGEDYTATDVAVPFADGETSKTVDIAIIDDELYEQDPESFTVTITLTANSGNARLGDDDTGNVRITSDDPAETGTFSFTETAADVTEADGTVSFDVQRVGGDNCRVDLTYTVNSGTADAGADFADAGDGTLSFADGDSANKTVTINLTDDNENESTEDFSVVIAAADPVDCEPGATATIGDDDTATVTMTSDEKEQFRFTAATYMGSESSGTAVLTVEPVDAISGTAVTVEFATANGTAMAPDDYVAAMDQLTWQDGESDARDITITVNEDSQAEGDEDFTVSISAVTTDTTEVVDPSTATVTIQDLPGVRIVANDYVSDGESGVITVTVERFGSFPEGGGQVEIAAVESDPQSAEAGSDFFESVFIIAWGDADEPLQKTRNFAINDDTLVEDPETFQVVLQNAVRLEIREPSTETLTITDDDFGFVLSADSYNTSESDGMLTVTVERVGVSEGEVSVDYATADGMGDNAAVAGEDYTATSGTVTFGDGVTTQTFDIPITNDAVLENPESFSVSLSNGQPDTNWDDTQEPATATVTIADNESVIEFTAATFVSAEDAGNATITLTRTGDLSGDASADVTLTEGTATADEDYVAETLVASWAPGESDASVEVQVNADNEFEDDETLTLSLGNPSSTSPSTVLLGDQDTAELTITNDDASVQGSVQFSAADYSALETAGTITVTVTREGGDDGAITVDYSVTGQSATAGEDYNAAAAGTLSWGDDDSTDRTITITLNDDASFEGDETIALGLSNPTGGAILGDPSATTATIIDNDTALRLASSTFSAAEGDGTVTITVERLGDTSGAVSVNYATADGTATAPEHYAQTSGTLSWADGDDTPQSFDVPVVDNDEINEDRSFSVTLSGPDPDTRVELVDPQQATVTITDDEDKLSFAAEAVSLSEGAGSVNLRVVRSGTGNGAVTVQVTTADESATAGEDYTAVTQTLTWADGETGEMTVPVPLTDDNRAEDAETFTASLSNATGDIIIGDPSSLTVTIVDNDQAGLVLTETGSGTQITEGGDGDTVLLSLATQPVGSVTITIDPPERVNVSPTTLVFTAQNWDQPRTVTLSIADDENAQADRTVSGSISASSDTDDAYDGLSETVTIVINDAGGVEVISGDSGSLGMPLLALLGAAAAWRRRRIRMH